MIAYTLQSLHGITKILTRDVGKTLCPYSVFLVTYVLYNWISQFKISCTIVWRRNSFSNCHLIFLGRFDPSELDLWPSNPKIYSVPLLPRMVGGPSLRRAGQGILELLNGNGFGTFEPGDLDLWPSDSSIDRDSLLPKMDVWTKFEEGRSRRSRVIDRKRFWHIWLWWPWPLT